MADSGLFWLVGILGAAGGMLSRQASNLSTLAKRRLGSSLVVETGDQSLAYLKAWLNENAYTKDARHLAVAELSLSNGGPSSSSDPAQTLWAPAPGMHILKIGGRKFLFNYSRQKPQGISERPHESMQFTCWGDARGIFRDLLKEAKEIYARGDASTIRVFRSSSYGGWETAGTRPIRTRESLILTPEIESVFDDLATFLSAKEWYRNLGLPWRRGYVLHGSPGNGKSSLAMALASAFGLNVYALTLSAGTTPTALLEMISNVPARSLLLIEEVDTAVKDRTDEDGDGGRSEPLLGALLNGLDGLLATEGRIVVMATNHLDRLDPALIRPGRADLCLDLGNATDDQARRIFARFFQDMEPTERDILAARFAAHAGDGRFSMAQLQEALLENRNDALAAVAHVSSLVEAGQA